MALKKIRLSLLLMALSGCATQPVTQSERRSLDPVPREEPVVASLHTGFAALDRLIERGEQQRLAADPGAAAATLERALRLAPRAPEVYVALARVHLDQQHYAKAEQMAQRALVFLGGDEQPRGRRQRAEAWLLVARSRRALGDEAAAEHAMRQAVGIW